VARRPLRRARVGPRFAAPDLRESSGLAASARAPGLLWTIGDGGAGPVLFAVAADGGGVLARVRVAGAANADWEALALGPCGAPNAAAGRAACLYVGDTGDNAAGGGGRGAGRAEVALYRVPEPLGGAAGPLPVRRRRVALPFPAATAPAEVARVRYADGPRDVEALAVLPDGGAWLVTKHPLARPDGTARPALVYRVGPEAWGAARAGRVAVARLVDSLPVVPDATLTHRVTDAAYDPARRLLAVRTYGAVYLVPLAAPAGGAGWRVDRARRATACDLGALREPQGEGVAFAAAPPDAAGPDARLVLSSEGNVLGPGGLAEAACPAPR
jgi:hypothetical protein